MASNSGGGEPWSPGFAFEFGGSRRHAFLWRDTVEDGAEIELSLPDPAPAPRVKVPVTVEKLQKLLDSTVEGAQLFNHLWAIETLACDKAGRRLEQGADDGTVFLNENDQTGQCLGVLL